MKLVVNNLSYDAVVTYDYNTGNYSVEVQRPDPAIDTMRRARGGPYPELTAALESAARVVARW